MSGLFITFEGTEGSGKSTQIIEAGDRLRDRGLDLVLLREPGGTSIGESVREILKDPAHDKMDAVTELLLMNASRAQLVREIIRPALARDQVVLCDRFFDSTIAYQVYGRGLDLDMARKIIDFATDGLTPDLTLLLESSPAVTETRLKGRTADGRSHADRIESAGRKFFEQVELGFSALSRHEPNRIRRIDASGSVEDVRALIWSEIERLLGNRSISKH